MRDASNPTVEGTASKQPNCVLTLTEDVLRYVDWTGEDHAIRWDDIERVVWEEQETDFGEPSWYIQGCEISFTILGERHLSVAFKERLKGFGSPEVDTALRTFRLPEGHIGFIECWKRPRV